MESLLVFLFTGFAAQLINGSLGMGFGVVGSTVLIAGGASVAEASAAKLYCAQSAMEVCLEAVQLFGGNGYMAEYRVEQLCRDAKVLQIYGGTDEIQISQIARSMLRDV